MFNTYLTKRGMNFRNKIPCGKSLALSFDPSGEMTDAGYGGLSIKRLRIKPIPDTWPADANEVINYPVFVKG